MPSSPSSAAGTITRYLKEWRYGDEAGLAQLGAAIYGELHRLAGRILVRESDPNVQPTLLVHELYLQLPEVKDLDWQSRAHFMNVAAKMMRNILVDHARKRRSLKRGGDQVAITVEPQSEDPALRVYVLLVHEALDRLALEYPRHARVVELRFFGGLTVDETVEVLRYSGTESSPRTVARDWTFASAWLQDAIRSKQDPA